MQMGARTQYISPEQVGKDGWQAEGTNAAKRWNDIAQVWQYRSIGSDPNAGMGGGTPAPATGMPAAGGGADPAAAPQAAAEAPASPALSGLMEAVEQPQGGFIGSGSGALNPRLGTRMSPALRGFRAASFRY